MLISQHKRDLNVVQYRREWKALYEEEAIFLHSNLGEKTIQIEHIGSTAIPGMQAKPIIDLMVAVDSLNLAAELIPNLEVLGYEYKPHDIIPERMFFSKEYKPDYRTHHLNLTQYKSEFWTNQLAFRDYLRQHPEMAAEYVALKVYLAETYAQTNELDRAGKTVFVRRVLELARVEAKTCRDTRPNRSI